MPTEATPLAGNENKWKRVFGAWKNRRPDLVSRLPPQRSPDERVAAAQGGANHDRIRARRSSNSSTRRSVRRPRRTLSCNGASTRLWNRPAAATTEMRMACRSRCRGTACLVGRCTTCKITAKEKNSYNGELRFYTHPGAVNSISSEPTLRMVIDPYGRVAIGYTGNLRKCFKGRNQK